MKADKLCKNTVATTYDVPKNSNSKKKQQLLVWYSLFNIKHIGTWYIAGYMLQNVVFMIIAHVKRYKTCLGGVKYFYLQAKKTIKGKRF